MIDPLRMLTLSLLSLSLALFGCTGGKSGGAGGKTPASVASMTSMDAIMHLQSRNVGPILSKRDQTSFDPSELETLRKASAYVVAVGTRLQDPYFEKKFDGGFKMFATQLQSDGNKLAAAVAANAGTDISGAIKTLGATCKACHAKYQKH